MTKCEPVVGDGMADGEAEGSERICRRCGTRYDADVSVCPSCGVPSAPKKREVSTGTGRREPTLDWTAVLLAVLTGLVVLTLALWVQSGA